MQNEVLIVRPREPPRAQCLVHHRDIERLQRIRNCRELRVFPEIAGADFSYVETAVSREFTRIALAVRAFCQANGRSRIAVGLVRDIPELRRNSCWGACQVKDVILCKCP